MVAIGAPLSVVKWYVIVSFQHEITTFEYETDSHMLLIHNGVSVYVRVRVMLTDYTNAIHIYYFYSFPQICFMKGAIGQNYVDYLGGHPGECVAV